MERVLHGGIRNWWKVLRAKLENSTQKLLKIFSLISRLVPIIKQGSGNKVPEGASDAHESASNHSENTGDNDKTTNNGNSGSGSRVKALQLAQNNENTGQFSPEVLFRACARSGAKYMDFGEFKLASKVLALNMHDQALNHVFIG